MTRKRPFPDPPEHLSDRAKELWRSLGPKEAGGLARRALFQSGLEALDTADQARRIIAAEGLIVKTAKSGVSHLHPAAKLEREARGQFTKIWTVLNLRWDREPE
jgi:phage terminase small subunit